MRKYPALTAELNQIKKEYVCVILNLRPNNIHFTQSYITLCESTAPLYSVGFATKRIAGQSFTYGRYCYCQNNEKSINKAKKMICASLHAELTEKQQVIDSQLKFINTVIK